MSQNPIRAGYRLTDGYGWRTLPNGVRNRHLGQDFACVMRTVIYPVMPGIVEDVGYSTTYGNYVIVRHEADNYRSLYAHMFAQPYVHEGQTVSYETWLGGVGHTGLSWGDHLHLGIFKQAINFNTMTGSVDPLVYLASTAGLEVKEFDDMYTDADRMRDGQTHQGMWNKADPNVPGSWNGVLARLGIIQANLEAIKYIMDGKPVPAHVSAAEGGVNVEYERALGQIISEQQSLNEG